MNEGWIVFDLETTGLGPDARVVLGCATVKGSGDIRTFTDVHALVDFLQGADVLVGHNITGFDIPVLRRQLGDPHLFEGHELIDTLLVSQQAWGAIMPEIVMRHRNAGRTAEDRERRYPQELLSKWKLHSAESWGYLLGYHKNDYLQRYIAQHGRPPQEPTPELAKYCEQDVRLEERICEVLLGSPPPGHPDWPVPPVAACKVESKVGLLLQEMQEYGICFDVKRAESLAAELLDRAAQIERELAEAIPARYEPSGPVTVPKRPNRKTGVEPGCAYQRVRPAPFHPGSTKAIEWWLRRNGWQPGRLTEKGHVVLDDEALAEAEARGIPHVRAIREYLLLTKRIGQLHAGAQAWLRKVRSDGRIHGSVRVSGTRTSRMSHQNPNLAQVPAVRAPYGRECRGLFLPPEGFVMVGADASGLELRMLAHYLAVLGDGGAFARLVLEEDPHEAFRKATGAVTRDTQKTWTYAFIYGGGDAKLGSILIDGWREAHERGDVKKPPPPLSLAATLGKKSRRALLRQFGALEALFESCARAYKRGWIRGLDGRPIATKSEHGAVNDLLQSAGAIAMKWAWVRLDENLRRDGRIRRIRDWHMLLNIHDEWQAACRPEHAEYLGEQMVRAIREAGELLNLNIPLDAEYRVGKTWADTH